MAPAPNEQFLISCIENSNGGTVDWQKVMEKCDMPTKGAASVRFRRLKEKFGSGASGDASPYKEKASNATDDGGAAPAKGKKRASPTNRSPKKRKLSEDKASDGQVNESEGQAGAGAVKNEDQD